MIITKQRSIGSLQQVKCGDVVLNFTEEAKSLGVLIDHKRLWESHIDKLYKSFSAQNAKKNEVPPG